MTLLFLHGSGCSSVVWEQQLCFFENGIALNLPGHPEGDALNKVSDMAQWLVSYIEDRKLSDIVLVGHSLGSAVAMLVALSKKINIKGLVLIGAGARLKVMPQLLVSLSELVEEHADIPDHLLSANHKIPKPLRDKINASMAKNGAAVMLKDFTACNHFDVMAQLVDIHIPVQIIVGDQDQMTPLKYASFLKDNLPQAELAIIKDGTHMVFAEQANLVNKQIEYFLDRI